MGKLQSRKRYVAPELREAKECADRCGERNYEAIWKRPQLLAERYMIASAAKFTGYDCAEDLEQLDRKIQQAIEELPVAREDLRRARFELKALKTGPTADVSP